MMRLRERTTYCLAGAMLVLVAGFGGTLPAWADLYTASSEYKQGDYAHAFAEFLALAELGQPQAQFNVAAMYESGQGVDRSDIHAYAWATLAAQNGFPGAQKMADETRPRLAPGSERIAAWFTAPYTPAALTQRLLPGTGISTHKDATALRQWVAQCHPVRVDEMVYPSEASEQGTEGNAFVAFTLMPDGTARIPRVILDVPPGVFAAATRKSILGDRFAPLPEGSKPIHCVSFYRFVTGRGSAMSDYPRLAAYLNEVKRSAEGGDPNSQLTYGMLLVGLPQLNKTSNAGLPWFLRAAQAGLPLGQFEIGYSLLVGIGCQRDELKAVRWLRMAADQNEPNAEVSLAMEAMEGSPGFGDMTTARGWLEKAAAQGNLNGKLYLSALLAAAPDPAVRDPRRALELLGPVMSELDDDPTAREIQAAAQAAEGDFTDAVSSEKSAIRQAHYLKWDLAPLKGRLADYQAGKPWYGDLLDF